MSSPNRATRIATSCLALAAATSVGGASVPSVPMVPSMAESSCVDDVTYTSPLGLSCMNHQQVDCHAFAAIGMAKDEIDELLRRCPNSCNVEGCDQSENVVDADDGVSLKLEIKSKPQTQTPDLFSFDRSLEKTCYDGKCQDDPKFRSKFYLPCESHVTFECGVLQAIGFTADEVKDLITSCPCSCRSECSIYEATEELTLTSPKPSPRPTLKTTPRPSKAPTPYPTRKPTLSPSPLPTKALPTPRPTLNPTSVRERTKQAPVRPPRSPTVTKTPTDASLEKPAVASGQTLGEIWEGEFPTGEYEDPVFPIVEYKDQAGDRTYRNSPSDEHGEIMNSHDGAESIPTYPIAAAVESSENYQTDDGGKTFLEEYGLIIIIGTLGGIVVLTAFARYIRHRARRSMEDKLVRSLAMEYRYGSSPNSIDDGGEPYSPRRPSRSRMDIGEYDMEYGHGVTQVQQQQQQQQLREGRYPSQQRGSMSRPGQI